MPRRYDAIRFEQPERRAEGILHGLVPPLLIDTGFTIREQRVDSMPPAKILHRIGNIRKHITFQPIQFNTYFRKRPFQGLQILSNEFELSRTQAMLLPLAGTVEIDCG